MQHAKHQSAVFLAKTNVGMYSSVSGSTTQDTIYYQITKILDGLHNLNNSYDRHKKNKVNKQVSAIAQDNYES